MFKVVDELSLGYVDTPVGWMKDFLERLREMYQLVTRVAGVA